MCVSPSGFKMGARLFYVYMNFAAYVDGAPTSPAYRLGRPKLMVFATIRIGFPALRFPFKVLARFTVPSIPSGGRGVTFNEWARALLTDTFGANR